MSMMSTSSKIVTLKQHVTLYWRLCCGESIRFTFLNFLDLNPPYNQLSKTSKIWTQMDGLAEIGVLITMPQNIVFLGTFPQIL